MKIKNKPLLYLGIFSTIAIVASIILRLITPQTSVVVQTPLATTNKNGTKASFAGLIFTGNSVNLPQTLPINSTLTTTSEVIALDNLIKKFNLAQHETLDFIWKGESNTLSKDENNNEYILTSKEQNLGPLPPITKERALSVATQQLTELFPNISVKPLEDSIEFLVGEYHLAPADEGQATLAQVSFTYQIEGYPVFFNHQENPPFQVLVNALGEVQKLTFQPVFVSLTPTADSQTIAVEAALKNINQSQGSIVSAYQLTTTPLNIDEISSGTLTSVKVEYRIDEQTKLAYPFYKFSGQIINSEGDKIDAQIITPAVITK